MAIHGYRELGDSPTSSQIADAMTAAALIDDYTGATEYGGLTVAQRTLTLYSVHGLVSLPLPMAQADYPPAVVDDEGDAVDLSAWERTGYRHWLSDEQGIQRFTATGRFGWPDGDDRLDAISGIIIDNLEAARAVQGDQTPQAADLLGSVEQALKRMRCTSA